MLLLSEDAPRAVWPQCMVARLLELPDAHFACELVVNASVVGQKKMWITVLTFVPIIIIIIVSIFIIYGCVKKCEKKKKVCTTKQCVFMCSVNNYFLTVYFVRF